MSHFGALTFEDLTTRDLAKEALREEGAQIAATISEPTPKLIIRLDPTDQKYSPLNIDQVNLATAHYEPITDYYESN